MATISNDIYQVDLPVGKSQAINVNDMLVCDKSETNNHEIIEGAASSSDYEFAGVARNAVESDSNGKNKADTDLVAIVDAQVKGTFVVLCDSTSAVGLFDKVYVKTSTSVCTSGEAANDIYVGKVIEIMKGSYLNQLTKDIDAETTAGTDTYVRVKFDALDYNG